MLQFSKAKKDELLIHTSCIVFIIFWALLQLWSKRYFEHYNDGVSYLDMASYYMQGNWSDGFNSFWNPLYPAFIALVFKVLQPNAFHEFLALKLVNFLIFLTLIGSFEFFLHSFLRFYDEQIGDRNNLCLPSKNTWALIAYGIFAYAFLCLNNIGTDTPDMMSAACMLVALASVLEIFCGASTTKNYLCFGFFSGIAYLAKAAALPGVLICLAFLWWRNDKAKDSKTLLYEAIAVIVLITAPYIVGLSIKVGEPTISTAAKLNYIWFVDQRAWSVHGPISETQRKLVLNPMRQIYENPSVFEFAQPVKGTYPPWYDPYYWYAGYKTQLHIDYLLITLLCNLVYFGIFFFCSALLILIAIAICYRRLIISRDSLLSNAILLMVSLIGFLQYAFLINLLAVFPGFINRYFSLSIVIFVLAIVASLRIVNTKQGRFSFKLGLAMMALFLSATLTRYFVADWKEAFQDRYFEHYAIAVELKKLGLNEGDYVAQIGEEEPLVDWARLARLRIVVDIPDSKQFWSISASKRRDIYTILEQKNVKAIIYCSAPISEQARALHKYIDQDWLGRIGLQPSEEKISIDQLKEPPQNEGWCRVGKLSCWTQKL